MVKRKIVNWRERWKSSHPVYIYPMTKEQWDGQQAMTRAVKLLIEQDHRYPSPIRALRDYLNDR